jgi:hypothetical protein
MTAEQTLLWDVTPKRPAPSARTVEQHTEPGSKRNDPLPSFLAAESLKSSGEWHRQLWSVYHGVRRFPGLTAAELTQRLGLADRYVCSRRLPELRDRFKAICNGPDRKCTVSPSRRPVQTWFCSRPFIERAHREGSSAPTAAARGGKTRTSCEVREPVFVTSPEERRRLREQLAASGDTLTRKFLAGLHPGGGGAK